MRALQKYRDIEVTPMAYYRFLTKFALFVGLIFNFYNTVNTILTAPYWVDILYDISVVVLNLLSLIWLRKMKWKGVVALCGLYLLSIVFNLTILILCVNARTDFSASVGRIIAQLLVAIPTWDYFDKRRFLFLPALPWQDEGEVSPRATAKCIEEENSLEEHEQSNERPIVYHGIYGEYAQNPIELPKLQKGKEPAAPKEPTSFPHEITLSYQSDFKIKPHTEPSEEPIDTRTFRICPGCGALLSTDVLTCDCGHTFQKPKRQIGLRKLVLSCLAIILTLVGFSYASYQFGRNSMSDELQQQYNAGQKEGRQLGYQAGYRDAKAYAESSLEFEFESGYRTAMADARKTSADDIPHIVAIHPELHDTLSAEFGGRPSNSMQQSSGGVSGDDTAQGKTGTALDKYSLDKYSLDKYRLK